MSTFYAVKMTNNGSFKNDAIKYDKNEKTKTPQAGFAGFLLKISLYIGGGLVKPLVPLPLFPQCCRFFSFVSSSQCDLNSVLVCGRSTIQRCARSRVFFLGTLVSCHRES